MEPRLQGHNVIRVSARMTSVGLRLRHFLMQPSRSCQHCGPPYRHQEKPLLLGICGPPYITLTGLVVHVPFINVTGDSLDAPINSYYSDGDLFASVDASPLWF